jgi:hypothetical protein
MAYNRHHASKLCTAAEFQLFRASQPDLVRTLSKAQVQSKIERARNLRAKYRDLFQRQQLATRARPGAKLGAHKKANERTEQKTKLFAEVLARFEARLNQMEAAERRQTARAAAKGAPVKAGERARSAKKPAGKKKVTAKKPKLKTKAKTKTGFLTSKAANAARKEKLQNTRAKAIQGHIRSRGKRNQAKRDKR